jgi:DNA primase
MTTDFFHIGPVVLIYKPESLEKLRQRVDLVELVLGYLPLHRAGASYKGLCPFHAEKSPSFVIQKGASHYHCFGCGAHGDAIAFLMTYLSLSFVDAVESLAERFQLVLEKVEGQEEKRGPNKVELRHLLEKATHLYLASLLYTEEGHVALHYLYERGMDLEWIRFFQIGFAPREGDFLYRSLHGEGFSDLQLEQAGLLVSGKKRDFFINRITFPIRDGLGSVIGFSARKFKEETFGGKYINTPETALFKKSQILFGFSYSRQRIAKGREAIIVEGQIDALRLIYMGFNYTVAGQGTAFGEGHVRELMQLEVNRVYLALDGDDAGREAMVKIGNLFQKKGVGVFVITLPQGSDPDSFLRERGPEAFSALLEESRDYLTFLVSHLSKKMDAHSPSGKTQLVEQVSQMIRAWEHPLMVHESLRKLAQLVQVPESVIGMGIEASSIHIKRSGKVAFSEVDFDRILETDLLRWLFLVGETDPKIVQIIQRNLTPDALRVESCRRLFILYLKAFEEGSPRDFFSIAIASSHAEDQEFLSEILKKRVNLQRAERGVIETVERLLQRNWICQREAIKAKIHEGKGSDAEISALVHQFDALKKSPPQVKHTS